MALSPQGFFHNNNKQRESTADAATYLNRQEPGTEQASAGLFRAQRAAMYAQLNQGHTIQRGLNP